MKTSMTRAPDNGIMRTRYLRTVGVTLAVACIFTTAPLRAETAHRGGGSQQHSQGHALRQAARHGDRGHGGGGYGYGDQGYGYGYDAPPVVYAPPAVAPGINLFLPL